MIRLAVLVVGVAALLSACATSIRSQPNSYSYLGRVVDKGEDVVVEPRSRNVNERAESIAVIESTVEPKNRSLAAAIYDALPNSKTERYQRYTVQLEQGEQISLRSYLKDLNGRDCVRVWIRGPGVSPVYLYAPDQAEIEKAEGCK